MECVYARLNRRRLPPFQVETTICRDGGRLVVVKKALTSEAAAHIADIANASFLVRENIVGDRVKLPAEFRPDDSSIVFDFIPGTSLDGLLFDSFLARDAEGFRKVIDEYADLLANAFRTAGAPSLDERMKQAFGLDSDERLQGMGPYFALTMIDAVFENILVFEESFFLIDNEWVFEGSLPTSFTLFRSLFYFYKVKYADFDIDSLVSFDSEMARHGLTPERIELFRSMDDSFQRHVSGERSRYDSISRYARQRYSVPVLEQTIAHQRDVIGDMHGQIVHLRDVVQDREHMVRSMDALIRSKDGLISEMDRLVREKDQLIAQMVNSRGWRFVQAATGIFNRACPPGTLRRRIVARILKVSA